MLLFSWEAVLLVVAICLDAFVASLAFGAEGIRVPLLSALVIDLVCGGILALSLLAGTLVQDGIPPGAAAALSCGLLTAMGLVRIFDGVVKHLIRRFCHPSASINFRLKNITFLLQIYADCVEADSNHSKTLSVKESLSLAIALSLDGMAAGFGAGMAQVGLAAVLVCSLLFHLAAVLGGCALGKRVAARTGWDLSWLSGWVLVLLGLLKVSR